jgi:hypothetical protein
MFNEQGVLNMKKKRSLMILLAAGLLTLPALANNLKAYYEQQKAEIAPTFQPPELGSEVSVKTVSSQQRTGILMKLNSDSLSLMTDTETLTYKRTALHQSSRITFFAEDYAHEKALEKTREYQQQVHQEKLDKEQANAHEARINVSAKVEKSSDKEVEKDERKNKKTGSTTTTTTTTRTFSEIQNLQITIANNTTHPDTYTLEWYFFAEPVAGGKTTTHDSGSRTVTVEARSRVQETASSDKFVSEKVSTERSSSAGGSTSDPKTTEKGKKNAGWVVLLKYKDELLDQKASSRKFLEEEWISRLKVR